MFHWKERPIHHPPTYHRWTKAEKGRTHHQRRSYHSPCPLNSEGEDYGPLWGGGVDPFDILHRQRRFDGWEGHGRKGLVFTTSLVCPQRTLLFAPLEIMPRCSATGVHFRTISVGFNVPTAGISNRVCVDKWHCFRIIFPIFKSGAGVFCEVS